MGTLRNQSCMVLFIVLLGSLPLPKTIELSVSAVVPLAVKKSFDLMEFAPTPFVRPKTYSNCDLFVMVSPELFMTKYEPIELFVVAVS